MMDRANFGIYLNDKGYEGKGVEVGCAHGTNSRLIRSQWNGKKLWMVDLWKNQNPEIYRERQVDPKLYQLWFEECERFADASDGSVELIRKASVDAALDFNAGSLDWVYIDANHSYEEVTRDIEAWFPKLRPGGWLTGHDYYDSFKDGHHCEVKRAVDDWAKRTDSKIEAWACSSWSTVKQNAD